MKRHIASSLVTIALAILAAGTELPDPEGERHDQFPVGTATGSDPAPTSLRPNEMVQGAMESGEDRYVAELAAGTTYTIDVRTPSWPSYDAERPLPDPPPPAFAVLVVEGTPDHPGAMVMIEDRMLPGVFTRAHVTARTSGAHTISIRTRMVGPSADTEPSPLAYELRLFDRDLPLCHPQDCFHLPDLP